MDWHETAYNDRCEACKEGAKYVVYVKDLNSINRKRKCVFRERSRDESIILY
jgi:hypothetical protein